MLLDCFIFPNLIYCPRAWHLGSAVFSQKIEKAQERALTLLYNDSLSRYKRLLSKAE